MYSELIQSLINRIRDRATSPLYGTFIISWLVIHWDFIYTAFFVSEDKIWNATHQLKNDYLITTYFDVSEPWFYVRFAMPLLLTVLIIWVFPKIITIPAFAKEEKDRAQKRRIRSQIKREAEQENLAFEKIKLEKLKTIELSAQTEKAVEATDPTKLWEADYQEFRESRFYSHFNEIVEAIYAHQGYIQANTGSMSSFRVSKEILSYAHTNGLVEFGKDKRSIEWTEKGKYFAKKFQLNK